MSTQAQDLTVRKSVVVDCSQEHAFETFTARIYDWWPFATHSLSERPESATFEPRVGGRVYEVGPDGAEHEWATVLAWEPPSRFVIDWHVTAGKPSTELEVRFAPEGDGTRVELEHRGWESWGHEAGETAESYNGGWDVVLAPFIEKASA